MISQLRVGLSRIIGSGRYPLSTAISHVNVGGRRILPGSSQRFSLDINNNYISNGFNTYSSVYAEASPNNSGSAKPEDSAEQKGAAGSESEAEKQLKDELTKAVNEVNSLKSKTKELEDKYLRTLAEMENLRTRMTKQINDAKLYATQSFCKDLADIEDILQLALGSVPKEEVTESNKHLKALYEGLVMTEARLLQVFKAHGLTQINPLNNKFNPNEHEAVFQKDEPGKESGTVILVNKIGYKLHDRVIRPAVVGVAK